MAKLDIAEKRLPQDGRIPIKIADKDIDIRVSIIPTTFGERVVLRLLDKSSVLFGMEEIGLSSSQLQILDNLIHRPNGILLVTGPTGSGKTTTLYAALSRINSPDKNIITIEDPVEYQLWGIGQIQVNPKIGLTFAHGLRSVLRHDPDVILVGEIRDAETAEIAIQAALTGHLVFSTLHTNDAASAVTRLVDMGVEPFLVSSVVRAIVAQRLSGKGLPGLFRNGLSGANRDLRDVDCLRSHPPSDLKESRLDHHLPPGGGRGNENPKGRWRPRSDRGRHHSRRSGSRYPGVRTQSPRPKANG
jgi:general secretion pathway protein E